MEIARMWKFNFKLNSFKKLNLFFATYVIDCVCDDMLMLPMICCVFCFFCCILFSFLDSCLEFFSLGQTKRNSNSPFGQKGLSSVPKSFLRACICKIPEWGYGPHTLCCKQTSEFKHGSSLFQLQQSDLKYVPGPTSSHDLHPIESGLEKRTKCSYFKYKSR